MRCPNLKELPSPPIGKTGWPWTEESPQMPEFMQDSSLWPKISIVTPCLNQGPFLEETIRSVLLQGYPNCEYIIIDGGSTDETLGIIQKYTKWLHYWISERDHGQTQAINKGFAQASGKIYAFINSDDLYELNAFGTVAKIFSENPQTHLVAGEVAIFDSNSIKSSVKPWWPNDLTHYLEETFSMTLPQTASFWSKSIYEKLCGFDESFQYCFDREFIIRIGLDGVSPVCVASQFARFREHPTSKTISHRVQFYEEHIPILLKHAKACGLSEAKKRKITRLTNNDIRYHRVFICWKKVGRLASVKDFFYMILRWPPLIFERRVLALARRLLTFPAKNVAELNYL